MNKNLNISSGNFQVVVIGEKGAFKHLNGKTEWVQKVHGPAMIDNRITLMLKDDGEDHLKSTDFNIKNVVFINADQVAETLSKNARFFGGLWSEAWVCFQLWALHHGYVISNDLK